MKIVYTAARLFLGLIFLVIGLNGLHPFIPAPMPPPGPALQFTMLLFATHYVWFTSGVQVICGILLLTNQYVPLALVVLGAVLSNILVFHIAMLPGGLPLALITTAIWVVVCWPYRSHFAQLFARQVPVNV